LIQFINVKTFVLNCNNFVVLMKYIFKLINIHFKIIIIHLFLNEHVIKQFGVPDSQHFYILYYMDRYLKMTITKYNHCNLLFFMYLSIDSYTY